MTREVVRTVERPLLLHPVFAAVAGSLLVNERVVADSDWFLGVVNAAADRRRTLDRERAARAAAAEPPAGPPIVPRRPA